MSCLFSKGVGKKHGDLLQDTDSVSTWSNKFCQVEEDVLNCLNCGQCESVLLYYHLVTHALLDTA